MPSPGVVPEILTTPAPLHHDVASLASAAITGLATPAPAPAGGWDCSAFTREQLTDLTGSVYYEEGDYSDNSFGCWSTDFLWAFLALCAACVLASRSRNGVSIRLCVRPGWEHTRYLLTWGLFWMAAAEAFAGWYHLVFTSQDGGKHSTVWTLALLALCLHCSAYLCACVAMHEDGDNSWFNFGLYTLASSSSVVLLIVIYAVDLSFPTAFAIASLVPLTAVGMSTMLHALKYKTFRDTIPILIGVAINLLAIATQWTLHPECASACPEGCPMPVPNFNHNALFHVVSIAALYPTLKGFVGICWELESPDGMPYFNMAARGHNTVRYVQSGKYKALPQEDGRHTESPARPLC